MIFVFYFRPTPPIDPQILQSMRMVGAFGYAPNSINMKRNEVRCCLLSILLQLSICFIFFIFVNDNSRIIQFYLCALYFMTTFFIFIYNFL